MKKIIIFIIVLMHVAILAQSQRKSTPQEIKDMKEYIRENKKLEKAYRRVQQFSAAFVHPYPASYHDSSIAANDAFEELLIKTLGTYPSSLRLDFTFNLSTSADMIYPAIAEDSSFKIYSWDTQADPSLADFRYVVQYKVGNGVKAERLICRGRKPDFFYDEIGNFTIGPKKYYVVLMSCRHPKRPDSAFQGAQIFTIDHGQLNDSVRLFKTSTGMHNKLLFAPEDLSTSGIYEGRGIPQTSPFPEYNHQTKTVSIPLLNEQRVLTNKRIEYSFTGKYFEKTGIVVQPDK